jgi:lipopolysaccharide export system protein LptA
VKARATISLSMRPRAGGAVFAVALAALLGVVPAPAAPGQRNPSPQGSPNALQGFAQNHDQPVKIEADGLVVRNKDKMATFTGNVHVTKGDTDMRSKVLVVYYVDGGTPGAAPGSGEQQQIRRIEAAGGVRVTQKDQNATGDNGVFDMQANTVTLNGKVVMTHGKDVVQGQRLVVDLGTGASHIDGGVSVLMGAGGRAPNLDDKPGVP